MAKQDLNPATCEHVAVVAMSLIVKEGRLNQLKAHASSFLDRHNIGKEEFDLQLINVIRQALDEAEKNVHERIEARDKAK